jgi:hypothetical protein
MENETVKALSDVLQLLKKIEATQTAHEAMLFALAFTHHEQEFLRDSFVTLMNDAEGVIGDPLKLAAVRDARQLLMRSLRKP